MTAELLKKVTDLRNSVAVDGNFLISKKWTDEQIASQIELLLNQNTLSEDKLRKIIEEKIKKIPSELSLDESVEWITDEMYKIVNWKKGQYIHNFWRHFGSAPFTLKDSNNPKLIEAKKKGAKGMDEIFDGKFYDGYSMTYKLSNLLYSVKERIEYNNEIKIQKTNIFTSPFKDVEEIIDTLPEKKAKEAGKVFYMDKTKPMEEREKAFKKYGDTNSYIHTPANNSLRKIFDIYNEGSYSQRHEIVSCLNILEWWMGNVYQGKTVIDYSKNEYHPSLKAKKRKYTPSKEAMEKLYNSYLEILFIEGVSNFELDW